MNAAVRLGQPLTVRELQVLTALNEGLSRSQIGGRLSITELTVKSHLRRIGVKLGTGNRVGIVAAAHRQGIIDGAGQARWPQAAPLADGERHA